VRFTGAVLVMGLCLLCLLAGYVWWSTRLSRAIDRIFVQQQQAPMSCPVEPIPAEWLPELAWEIARDRSELEAVREWIEGVLPPKSVPEALCSRPPGLRRDRALIALAASRDLEEVLDLLEGILPRASTDGTEWILSLSEAITTPGHPRRTSLFLAASMHPDPRIRHSALELVDPSPGRPARSAEVRVRVEAMVDDQVSVVRERARTVVEGLRTLPGAE
jgi:hypothetical protein